jgi:hypothetical protein
MASILSKIIRSLKKVLSMDDKRQFSRGDVIVKSSIKGWFAIYDGSPIKTSSYTTKYSLVLMYDPEKYQKDEETGVYEKRPYLVYATSDTPCPETIDEDKETFWMSIADEDQINDVNGKLCEHGLFWDKVTMSLLCLETGEVIKQLKAPKTEYDGSTIIPSSGYLTSICAGIAAVNPKPITSTYDNRNNLYGDYRDAWGRYGYDEYD